jgi:hypothetical protein
MLSSVTTLPFDNGLCSEKSKYAHCSFLNSRRFEEWLHIFSQISMRPEELSEIELFEFHFDIASAVLFCYFRFEQCKQRKPRQ